MRKIACAVALILAGPVAAQVDPMAVQRCIWSCLAQSPGAGSWQYNQCVATQCAWMGQAPVPAPVETGPWRSGLASDGFSQFAGLDVPALPGVGVYYFCSPARVSYLSVIGLEGPAGVLEFQVDNLAYRLNFNRSRGELSFDLPPRSPFLNVLGQGRNLRVVNAVGTELFTVSLGGAAASLARAQAACGM